MNPLDQAAAWAEDADPQPGQHAQLDGAARSEFAGDPGTNRRFDLDGFLLRHNLEVCYRAPWNGGEKLVLKVCPINPEHNNDNSPVITVGSDGRLGFRCQHKSCFGIGWREMRAHLEPGYGRWVSGGFPAHASASEQTPWPALVQFADRSVERIPVDLMPGPVGDMARAVAVACEVPIELPLLAGLGIAAASIAGKVEVSPTPGYKEPAQIFTATALPSGNRKTGALNEMRAPLIEAEARLIETATPEYKRKFSELKTLEAIIKKKRGLVAGAKGNRAALIREINELEANLPEMPVLPQLWTQDVTPEALGTLMAAQGGIMANISDEGGIFDILAGRYSAAGTPNLDLFLQGHAGSPVRVHRVSRLPVIINAPALTLVLTPQPEVLRDLADKKGFRSRGLLARFSFWLPPSPIGTRTHDTTPVPRATRTAYDKCISSLLAMTTPGDNGVPLQLGLSVAALSRWKEFRLEVEKMMADYGKLQDLRDWGSKLPGAILRIAAGIHCSLHAHGPLPRDIQPETMDIALKLAAPMISNALAVFAMMEKPEQIAHAEKLLSWILKNGKIEFTLREMFCAHNSRFKVMVAMTPAVTELQERGYIRPAQQSSKPGRPSEVFEVRPELLDHAGDTPPGN
jgi:hypothetical protein